MRALPVTPRVSNPAWGREGNASNRGVRRYAIRRRGLGLNMSGERLRLGVGAKLVCRVALKVELALFSSFFFQLEALEGLRATKGQANFASL